MAIVPAAKAMYLCDYHIGYSDDLMCDNTWVCDTLLRLH